MRRYKWPLDEDAGIQKHVPHFDLEYGDEFGNHYWYKRKNYNYHVGKFRCGPVTNIRKHKAGIKCFRRPKTIQTLRWNNAWTDIGIKGRGKLNELPTNWDDIPCRWNEKSWKRYRKTQYKLPRS